MVILIKKLALEKSGGENNGCPPKPWRRGKK